MLIKYLCRLQLLFGVVVHSFHGLHTQISDVEMKRITIVHYEIDEEAFCQFVQTSNNNVT